jgi:hypothetical protein
MQVPWICQCAVLLLAVLKQPITVQCQQSYDPVTVTRFGQNEILRELQSAINAISSIQCQSDFNETIAGIEARQEWAVASKF